MSKLSRRSISARPWTPSLVPMSLLRAHEEIDPEHLRALMEEILRDGVLKRPLLVESRFLIILDGHHRYEALRAIGAKLVPIFPVDYSSPNVLVDSWRPGWRVTKELVLEAGLTGRRLPYKTSRHILRGVVVPELNTPLRALMDGDEW